MMRAGAHPSKVFGWAVLAALAVHLALFAWSLQATAVLRPFSDMFDLVLRWLQFREDGDLLGYLLGPHNYHRLVWTRLLIDADMRWLHGGEGVFLAAGTLSLLAAPLILCRPIWRGAPEGLRLPAVALAAMLILSTANTMDASIPIYTPYAEALALSLACLVLAEGRWRPAAWLFAILAALANSAALVLWPAMIFSDGRRGERGWAAAALLLGAVFVGLYLFGQTPIGHEAHGLQLVKAGHYLLAFLGLPWTRVSGALGVAIGLGVLVASAPVLLFKGGPGAGPLERLAIRLVLFSLGAAGMAAVGRLNVDDAVDVPLRYALFMAPLQIGFVLLALPYLARIRERRPSLVRAGLLALFAGLLVQQAAVGWITARIVDRMRGVIAAFEAEAPRTPEMTVFVHPDLDHAYAVRRRMIANGYLP